MKTQFKPQVIHLICSILFLIKWQDVLKQSLLGFIHTEWFCSIYYITIYLEGLWRKHSRESGLGSLLPPNILTIGWKTCTCSSTNKICPTKKDHILNNFTVKINKGLRVSFHWTKGGLWKFYAVALPNTHDM